MKLRVTGYGLRVTAAILGLSLALSGCIVRSYPVTRDRVDQDLSGGNKGYLQGEGPEIKGAAERKTTRTTQVVEIELYPPIKFEKEPKIKTPKTSAETAETVSKAEDREVWGNRGFITQSPVSQKPGLPETAASAKEANKYIVQKGDTLQKISRKFFGTTKKWPKLYEANKDVLKGPNKLYPGQELTIPSDYSALPEENLK